MKYQTHDVAASIKPVLSPEEKKAERARKRLESDARDAKIAHDIAVAEREKFIEDTKNWNERLLNAVLEFTTIDGYTVYRFDAKVSFSITDDRHDNYQSYIVNQVPTSRGDLWTMDQIEGELADYQERLTEQKRLVEVRKIAVAKLTEEERKVLGV